MHFYFQELYKQMHWNCIMRKLTFYRHVTNAHIGCVVTIAFISFHGQCNSTFLISQMSRFKHFVVVLSGLCGTYSETSKSVFLVTRPLPYVAVQYTCTSNKIKPLHQPALFRCNFEVTQKSRYDQRSESMKNRMRNSPENNRKPTECLWSKPQTKSTSTYRVLLLTWLSCIDDGGN